jgi:hypothetical protein
MITAIAAPAPCAIACFQPQNHPCSSREHLPLFHVAFWVSAFWQLFCTFFSFFFFDLFQVFLPVFRIQIQFKNNPKIPESRFLDDSALRGAVY